MDEQEKCNRLERLCGGAAKAEQLQRIWNNTIGWPRREDAFRVDAKQAGFSSETINLFLTM